MAELAEKNRNSGQVMIVVFGDKKHVIKKTHGLVEPRMQRCPSEDVWVKGLQTSDEGGPDQAERRKNSLE